MLNAKELGSTLYNKFVQERLIDGSKGFFDSILRTKLNTGIEKAKKLPKAVEILKEDRQAFGIIIAKSLSMDEAFKYPITTVPLSLATIEFSLRQSDKATFRNLLLEESQCVAEVPPKNCAWFVDGMAIVRSLKPKTTYKEYIDALLKYVTPKEDLEPYIVGIINDTYRKVSVKVGMRQDRGEAGPRLHISSPNQHMFQGMRWKEFLHDGENKEELIKTMAKYFQTIDAIKNFKCPVTVTANNKTYEIDVSGNVSEFGCNHEEVDT